VVVCNPPFRKKESGRINPDPQRAIARHEIMISLADILSAASMILKPGGRLAMIYPAFRLNDVLREMGGCSLEPKKIQVIYPGMSSEAKLFLVEAGLGGRGGLKILPPIIDQGDFSIERQF
jgi:tRNA1Val (adenine37-N6)-methyltransferase